MNKKGIATEDMIEIGGSFLVFVIVVIVFFIFSAFFGSGKVYATMEAENAAFTCNNNVIKFMNFNVPGHTDYTYEKMLLKAYTSGDYSTFEEQAGKIFDKFIMNRWSIKIRNATSVVHPFGYNDLDYDSTESCLYRVAVPCLSHQDCTLLVQLELDYKKLNCLYHEGC